VEATQGVETTTQGMEATTQGAEATTQATRTIRLKQLSAELLVQV